MRKASSDGSCRVAKWRSLRPTLRKKGKLCTCNSIQSVYTLYVQCNAGREPFC